VARASRTLALAPPTLSGQIRALEESLGERLFTRSGRGLLLTEAGRVTFRYADEIFALGRELGDALRGRATGRPPRLHVGIADVVPKLVAQRLLEPAQGAAPPVAVVAREGRSDRLVGDLLHHTLDLVLTDAPVGVEVRGHAFNHLLGECGVAFFAAPPLARRLRRGFPRSLDRAPFLLPAEHTTLRRALQGWFAARGVQPAVAGEFDDSALLNAFGQAGVGVFAAPEAIGREIRRQHGVQVLGRAPELRERFYAITVERRVTQPAVAAICDGARRDLFAAMP